MPERIRLIHKMTASKFDLRLMREFSPETLQRSLSKLRDWISGKLYAPKDLSIQWELLQNPDFVKTLSALLDAGVSSDRVNVLLSDIHKSGKSSMDYTYPQFQRCCTLAELPANLQHDYLQYFGEEDLDKDAQHILVSNLMKVSHCADLSDAERHLLKEPFFLEANLGEQAAFRGALALLAGNPGLLELLRFLHTTNAGIHLTLEDYGLLCQEAGHMLTRLQAVHTFFQDTPDTWAQLLKLWVSNHCASKDLDRILQVLVERQTFPAEALKNRGTYVHALYGKTEGLNLEGLPPHAEDVVLYAIMKNQQAFLKLVRDNFDVLCTLRSKSILFAPEFYREYVNLNSLNKQNLADCAKVQVNPVLFKTLKKDRLYTFAEIKKLACLPVSYTQLYNALTLRRVDDLLLTLRQLSGHSLLDVLPTEEAVALLGAKLSIKSLHTWMAEEYGHIQGLTAPIAVRLLVSHEKLAHLIPRLVSESDARLLLHNVDLSADCTTLDAVKHRFIRVDPDWNTLMSLLQLPPEFIQQNYDRVLMFLSLDGPRIALPYHKCLKQSKQESFSRVVKAELLGRLHELKYHAGDLQREVDYTLEDGVLPVWMEDSEVSEGGLLAREYTDFFSTMLAGSMPTKTCLDYADGTYQECLLSLFDTNKKILYVSMDGKIVGRAVLRLTKGRFDDTNALFTFVDLTNQGVCGEHVTLFLERIYTSGISDSTVRKAKALLIRLVEAKAARLKALPVLSRYYDDVAVSAGYCKMEYSMYISKSKAGKQYLDSLGGYASASNEASYKTCEFYLQKGRDVNGTKS
jgi:hypothetical protein